jgi:ankyrin repeat protein
MASNNLVEEYNFDRAASAASRGDIATLKLYLDSKKIDVNKRAAGSSVSLLHHAVIHGHLETARFLLDRGANPNAENIQGQTPLMFLTASSDFSAEMADLLFGAGAQPSYTAKTGQNALLTATSNSASSREAIDWLVSKGVNIHSPSSEVLIPPVFNAVAVKNLGVLQAYLDNGTDLAARDNDGNSILMVAVASANRDQVRIILEAARRKGKDIINLTNNVNQNAMHSLASSVDYPAKEKMSADVKQILADHIDIARQLIDAGIDVNAIDSYNSTPLHYAAARGNKELVPLLLEKGARTSVYDFAGRTPFTSATGSNKNEVAAIIAEVMSNEAFYESNSAALKKLDRRDLGESLVAAGTNVKAYPQLFAQEYRVDSPSAPKPLQDFVQKRKGVLMVTEAQGDHHQQTYFSALHTYSLLTGIQEQEAEKSILAVSETIEELGILNKKTSPSSQFSPGYRALIESTKNADLLAETFLSASYYRNDEGARRYDPKKEGLLKQAENFYEKMGIAGIGIAVGNNDLEKNVTAMGQSQPLRSNPATVFVGAAEKSPDGTYLARSYSERGPHIMAPLPALYDKGENKIGEGTSFSTPAFNTYRLALFNGTRHLTPREIDAVLMTTASHNVIDDVSNKPLAFVNNGTVSYNDKAGVGVADVARAYQRAQELDEQKQAWLKDNAEDKPVTLNLSAKTPAAMRKVTINDVVKYEYSLTVPQNIFVQQFTSNTLSRIGSDGNPMGGQSRIIAPNGFTQHARADVYGNASLPGMFGIKLKQGDTIKILSDQPLREPSVEITGYDSNSFFALMMNQEQAKRVASKMKEVKVSEPCAVVVANIFNASAAKCNTR